MFVKLVGKPEKIFDSKDGSHALIHLTCGETYTVAVNIHSKEGSDVQYMRQTAHLFEDEADGLRKDVSLSYAARGLSQSEFVSVTEKDLFSLLSDMAEKCNRICVYGMMFDDGDVRGIHDVHFMNGEPESSRWKNVPDSDGALAFLFEDRCEWVYIKFASQTL